MQFYSLQNLFDYAKRDRYTMSDSQFQLVLDEAAIPGTRRQWADGKWHIKQEDGTWAEESTCIIASAFFIF